MAAMVTTAKASFISRRSTSPTDQPASASIFCMAPTGGGREELGLVGVGGVADDGGERLNAQILGSGAVLLLSVPTRIRD